MRVVVEFEIETPDYSGSVFMQEIIKLLHDIDPEDTHLLAFKMREKSPYPVRDWREIDWSAPGLEEI